MLVDCLSSCRHAYSTRTRTNFLREKQGHISFENRRKTNAAWYVQEQGAVVTDPPLQER